MPNVKEPVKAPVREPVKAPLILETRPTDSRRDLQYLHGRISGTSVAFSDKTTCTGPSGFHCRCIYCEFFRDNLPKIPKKGFLKKAQNEVLTSAQVECVCVRVCVRVCVCVRMCE